VSEHSQTPAFLITELQPSSPQLRPQHSILFRRNALTSSCSRRIQPQWAATNHSSGNAGGFYVNHVRSSFGTERPPLAVPVPNLNAYAERFVRTIKESCLNRVILVGERSLRNAIREFIAHYHPERIARTSRTSGDSAPPRRCTATPRTIVPAASAK
jgi:hypothetical protein